MRSILIVALCLNAALVWSQSPTATVMGRVTDPSQALIPAARIDVQHVETGWKHSVETNVDGYYSVSDLSPGTYRITVSKIGFKTIVKPGVVLRIQDIVALNFAMEVGSTVESVTVSAGVSPLQESSASVGGVIDRAFVENLPLNGRSLHALLELTAGITLTSSVWNEPGQFSANGQRSNANYFMVDGVSANIGVSRSASPNQQAGGSLPEFSVSGSTASLVSVDALQEFRIQTSTYSPEFGRTPGAQISMVTRSGGNRFTGSLFEYFRNDKFDANDWFANANRLVKPPLRQNNFGGVLGGPIVRNKTFFFFSYEGLRLRQPQTQVQPVPTLTTRAQAIAGMKPIFNAYPSPTGRDFGDGTAEHATSYSDPSTLDATSIRIDHNLKNRVSLFGRYNHAPSQRDTRGYPTSTVLIDRTATKTVTVGATTSVAPRSINDLRFNWSGVDGSQNITIVPYQGAAVPMDSDFFPNGITRQDAFFFTIIGTLNLSLGRNVANQQRQWNIIDTHTFVTGGHQFKAGVDYRRLSPLYGQRPYDMNLFFNNVTEAVAGRTFFAQIGAQEDQLRYKFDNLSIFALDMWRLSPRLTLTYGLRWEYNPPPTSPDGKLPFTVVGLNNPATMTLAPQNTELWQATRDNFAPRIGLAYVLRQNNNWGTVLRGGYGLFYDLGNGQALNGANAFPYNRLKQVLFATWPLAPATAAPPPFSTTPPYGRLTAFTPDLELPYTHQWNVAVEQALAKVQTLSVSYVGSAGRRLLRQEVLQKPNASFNEVRVVKNGSYSDYHAMQVQYQRRLSRGLQALVAYTWSHAIDTVSRESQVTIPDARSDPRLDRASSNFDLRHIFSASSTYELPSPRGTGIFARALADWSADLIFRFRSEPPLSITTGTDPFRLGVGGLQRPDAVAGVPVWVDDVLAPGGRRINKAAFVAPTDARQGMVGRNSLRGFSASQVDLSMRRQFRLTERLQLQARAEAFNVFNHPNFASPIVDIRSGQFGYSTQSLGRALGGLSPIYQIGGPRSMQLALKILF